MRNLQVETVDRPAHSLFACALFLGVLFLWHRSYAGSCGALVFPVLVWLAIFGGLLQSRLERRRFAVDYYLDPRSFVHRRLRGAWLSVPICLCAAGVLATFLAVFATRSRPADWYFLCAAAATAPLFFSALTESLGRHVRRRPRDHERRATVADILLVRMAGRLLLPVLAVGYVTANYFVVPVPTGIDPGSLERTLETFAAGGRSACPLVEDVLLIATQAEGLSWYFVTTAATSEWLHEGVGLLLWIAFFLNTAVVFEGVIRGLEGSILLACRTVPRYRQE